MMQSYACRFANLSIRFSTAPRIGGRRQRLNTNINFKSAQSEKEHTVVEVVVNRCQCCTFCITISFCVVPTFPLATFRFESNVLEASVSVSIPSPIVRTSATSWIILFNGWLNWFAICAPLANYMSLDLTRLCSHQPTVYVHFGAQLCPVVIIRLLTGPVGKISRTAIGPHPLRCH